MRTATTLIVFALLAFAMATPSGAITMDNPDTHGDFWIDHSDTHHAYLFWGSGSGSIQRADCSGTGSGGVVTAWTLKVRNAADYRRSTVRCVELATDGELRGESAWIDHFSYDEPGTDRTTEVGPHRLPVGVALYLDFRLVGPLKVFDVAMLDATRDDVLAENGIYRAASRATYDLSRTPAYDLLCDEGHVVTGIDVLAKHGAGAPNQAEIREVRLDCSRLRKNPEANAPADSAPVARP